MIWIDFLVVMIFALILSSLIGWGLGWRHPASSEATGTSVLFLFLILMFAMWAAGAWLPPWGPVVFGASWLTLLVVGLFVGLLLLAAATPARPPRTSRQATAEASEAAAVGAVFGLFFWLLLIGLLIAIIARYIT